MDKEELEFMLDDGINYISDEECCNDKKCDGCVEIERCYFLATTRLNHEFAVSCDFGGYDTEEEFWDNL